MMARSFCTWITTVLLPNSNLESGAPRRISVEVARKWLHSMGFEVKPLTKGIYIDEHERDDVVEVRDEFLNKMTSLGFLHSSNSPSEEMACLLPNVELSPDHDKTIFWFHDESSYNANDDERTMWKDDTMQVLKPKGRGAGIMVSDFIEERDGYLCLSDSMHQTLVAKDTSLPKSARVLLPRARMREQGVM